MIYMTTSTGRPFSTDRLPSLPPGHRRLRCVIRHRALQQTDIGVDDPATIGQEHSLAPRPVPPGLKPTVESP